MAFNPISIDAGGGSLLSRRRTAVNGDGDLPGPANAVADRATSSPFLVSPSATLSHAGRQCMDHYYFEYFWRVPMPEHPAAPLLYAPQPYKDHLQGGSALSVMQCEVKAMANGVLESVPLAYYPLRLDGVKEMRQAAIRTQQHIDAMQQRAKDAGKVELVTWTAKDANPTLAPADLDLLDTDMDQSLVLQKDLPSLSLLQRPIYTEMGLVPEEQRHQLRVARIVPASLAAFNPNGSPRQPGSPGPAAMASTAFSGGAAVTTGGAAAAAAVDPSQNWAAGVQDSFRLARSLDQQFDAFIAQIAQRKLGLDRAQPAHAELARKIWVTLTSSSASGEEKHYAWYSLCYFSTHYGESTHEKAVSDMLSHQHQKCRTLQADRAWVAAMKTYTDAVEVYTKSLKDGVEQRRRQLHVADSELDALESQFQPELNAGTLLRRHGEEVTATNMPVPIYPVEVLPVFPTGFNVAAAEGLVNVKKSEEGELDFLAESFADVHHLVLPAAVGVGGAVRSAAPHILIGGANLLLAESDHTDARDGDKADELAEDERLAKAASAIVPGGTMSYRTVRMNTFQPLYEDPDSTASYVMHLCESDSAEMAASMTASGSSSTAGRYATYDRVGFFNVYTKANNPEEPLFGRYVVVFDEDEDKSEVPVPVTSAGHKRAREDDEAHHEAGEAVVVKKESS